MNGIITKKQFCISYIFFILISNNLLGQNNCKPASITTLNGKTIIGCIEYKNWSETPKFIRFKANSATETIEYTAADIKAFTVNERTYKSGKVETETSPRDLSNITESKKIQIKTATVFLRNLIEGKKSLYLFVDEKGNDHFYIYEDGVFELLRYKKYFEIDTNQKKSVKEYKEYLGQLSKHFETCPYIKDKLVNVKYKKSSLLDIFRDYKNCYGLELEHERKIQKNGKKFGLLGGITNTTLDFNGDTDIDFFSPGLPDYIVPANFTTSRDISGGIYFSLTPAKASSRWTWTNEIMYQTYRVQASYHKIYSIHRDVHSDFDLGFSYLRLNSMGQYKLPIQKFSVYAKMGLSAGRVLSERSNYRKEVSRFLSTVTENEYVLFPQYKKNEVGAILSLGLQYKNLFGEIRGEVGEGMSDLIRLGCYSYRGSLLIGWEF